jgi:peptidoglycan/xylan/chitin deacetylase (PgdA/CDA1 family)
MKPSRYGPFPYSPIVDRPKTRWPNGARLALWVVPNIEIFALDEEVPKEAGGSGKAPAVLNWAPRDYGNRVGIFRLFDVLDAHGVRGTVALNSEICDRHPRIIEECLKRDWELMGHNESNTRRLDHARDGEDAGIVRRAVATIGKASGRPVRGWLSSGLAETWNTLDHLADNGVEYVADWVNDDQPYEMTLEDGRRIMSVPYSTELNDKVVFEIRHATADEFEAMIKAQFDVLWREGAEQARVMCIAVHPYLIGQPYRIGALDRALKYILGHEGVWRATGLEIAQAGRELLKGAGG